jgi:hypothetical protein
MSGILYEEPPKAFRVQSDEVLIEESPQKRKQTNLRQVCSLKSQTSTVPLFPNDKDHVAAITFAYLRKRKAVLIFVPTKAGCQKVAQQIANLMPISFPEYATSTKNSPIKPSPTKPLEWTDLVTELTDITA